ncbi:MAG: hypothetical protein Q7R66_14990 [Undibacterium sp.]|uniref:ORC-CDC6 family AAA ATPase n=1 Tax=Undibacterium sp. TaxID=1914977 RepID=UPI0027261BEF|nr:hypothetical protein [Undibacterium sp.]MDO8653489.1 hypothetical protein [Undibacterium sp.]
MNINRQAFIRNRAEEYGHDVWNSYVLPLYFDNLGLHEARKSVVIEGGRGCGKTALLRYLSFHSQFSATRISLPDSALETVGLYLKADTQYFSAFAGAGIDASKWRNIFEHALCLALVEQIVGSVSLLNCNSERQKKFGKLDDLDFSKAVRGFSKEEVPASLKDFGEWIKYQRQQLARWFRNFDDSAPPERFPLIEFLQAVIGEIRIKLPYFENTVFAVYIDEYENLLDDQQRFLNTLMKGGEPPLIFHIAMKPNGMRTRMTVGNESIQEKSDYRKVKLDDELKADFALFSAELFFFILVKLGLPESSTPIIFYQLQDESQITLRQTDEKYRNRVLSEIKRVLPGQKNIEIAASILDDAVLYKRWYQLVSDGLNVQNTNLKPEQFLDKNYPDASIVSAALLFQATKNAEEILDEFNKLKTGAVSRFKEGDWIHHLLIGTLLLIYLPYRQRPCPMYAGFNAFVSISSTNVRHFLELCHTSVGKFNVECNFAEFYVPIENQARAAFKTSATFKEEVAGSGDMGNRLLAIVNFLGKLFRLSQGRPSQSEAERTHFCIINDQVSEGAQNVLNEAIKWSVFFEAPESKVKGTRYESSEYVLNPIYAPFFGISYNKGRKLEILKGQAETILTGGVEDFTKILKQYEKQWAVSTSEQFTLGLED